MPIGHPSSCKSIEGKPCHFLAYVTLTSRCPFLCWHNCCDARRYHSRIERQSFIFLWIMQAPLGGQDLMNIQTGELHRTVPPFSANAFYRKLQPESLMFASLTCNSCGTYVSKCLTSAWERVMNLNVRSLFNLTQVGGLSLVLCPGSCQHICEIELISMSIVWHWLQCVHCNNSNTLHCDQHAIEIYKKNYLIMVGSYIVAVHA